MQRRFWAASLVIVAGLSLSLVGCGEVDKLKARKAFKDATANYQQQDYKKAADKFKEAITFDPEYAQAYFYLANSYDNLFKATKKGQPENDKYLSDAIKYYKEAAAKDPSPAQRKLANQFLLNDYGPDKADDPAQLEPLIHKMIQDDPSDLNNYFALAKLYEDAGQYDQAEQWLNKARETKPKDPLVYQQLAGFWNRQGEFEKAIQSYQGWVEVEPKNPVAHYTIAAFYWDKGYRDRRLKDNEKMDFAKKGLAEAQKAIDIKPDYIEALTSKGLLLRLEASLVKDKGEYESLMKQAQAINDQVSQLQKKKAAGMGN